MATIIDENHHLVKMKQAGLAVEHIARKLGWSVEEVEKRWKDIELYSVSVVNNGYAALCDAYTVLCQQHNLLGESLKIVSQALSTSMPVEEVRALVTEDKEQTVRNIMQHCLVLRPFVPPSPEQLALEADRIREHMAQFSTTYQQ